MKNKHKYILSIAIILFITMLIISGSTFAYLQWRTSSAQRTGLAIQVTEGIGMYIENPEVSKTGMYPTSNCASLGAMPMEVDPDDSQIKYMAEPSVIYIENQTGVMARPRFKLKVKITDINGNPITSSYRQYIHYAVTEVGGDCTQPLVTGTFDQNTPTSTGGDWYNSNWVTYANDTNFPTVSIAHGMGVSFNAAPYQVTTHEYQIWAWIDSGYTTTVVGNQTVTDPLQNATISVSWSEDSAVDQIHVDAYAVYSSSDKSLRFYKSDEPITVGSTYNGLPVTNVYTGFESGKYTADTVPWKNVSTLVESVIFEDEINPISTAYWFNGFAVGIYFDVTKLDTSNVVSMESMFSDAGTNINTTPASGVKYNDQTFKYSVRPLTNNLNKPVFIDDKVIEFTIIGMEYWDTSNVKEMANMFKNVGASATKVNISNINNWNTSSVTSMSNMFSGVTSNTASSWNLNLGNWDVSKVTKYDGFHELENVITPVWYTTYAVHSSQNNGGDNSLRFYRTQETITEGSTYNGLPVTKVYKDFENKSYSSYSMVPWHEVAYNLDDMDNFQVVLKVVIEDEIYPISTAYWFADFQACTYFDLTKLNTSNVTNMSNMFSNAAAEGSVQTFKIIGMDKWDVSSVINMSYMFSVAPFATTIDIGDISNWDVSSVTNMSNMFSGFGYSVSSLELNIGDWNVSNVTDMRNMFFNAGYSAKDFNIGDLGDWDVSNVTDMMTMFALAGYNATNNWSMDLSGWDVSKVTIYDEFNEGVEDRVIPPNFNS